MHDEGDSILHLLEDHGSYLRGPRCGGEAHVPVRDEGEGLHAERVRLRAGDERGHGAEEAAVSVLVVVLGAGCKARQERVMEVAGVHEGFGRVGGRPAHVRVVVGAGRADGASLERVRIQAVQDNGGVVTSGGPLDPHLGRVSSEGEVALEGGPCPAFERDLVATGHEFGVGVVAQLAFSPCVVEGDGHTPVTVFVGCRVGYGPALEKQRSVPIGRAVQTYPVFLQRSRLPAEPHLLSILHARRRHHFQSS